MKLHFPVLAFPFSGRTVIVVNEESFFQKATRSQLKAGFFKVPFRIIDSSAIEYVADRLIELGGIGRFGGWNLFLNRNLQIQVDFRTLGEVSIQELRERVNTALRDDPTGIWLGGEFAPEELCDKVDAARSTTEVIAALQ